MSKRNSVEVSYVDEEENMYCRYNDASEIIAELEAELAQCKERMLKAETVCKEASDYLETNAYTNIGHGSILHRMFQDIRATAKAKENE